MKLKEAIKLLPLCDNFKTDFSTYAILTAGATLIEFYTRNDIKTDKSVYLFFLASMIAIGLLTCGYYLVTLRNYMLNKPNFLPKWLEQHDMKQILIGGLKYFMAIICCIAVVLIWNALGMFLISVNREIQTQAMLTLLITDIAFFLSMIVFLPAITIEFCTNLKFRSFFNFKQMLNIIQTSGWHYYRVVAVILGLNVIVMILMNFANDFLILNLILSIVSTYISLIAAILYGDVFRKVVAKHKENESEAN